MIREIATLFQPRIFFTSLFFVITFALLLLLLCPDPEEHFNGIEKQHDNTLLKKLGNRVYFATITITTLGYGDISPKSGTARALVIMFIFLNLLQTFKLLSNAAA